MFPRNADSLVLQLDSITSSLLALLFQINTVEGVAHGCWKLCFFLTPDDAMTLFPGCVARVWGQEVFGCSSLRAATFSTPPVGLRSSCERLSSSLCTNSCGHIQSPRSRVVTERTGFRDRGLEHDNLCCAKTKHE